MTRIFFATDIHGSEKCFRKFINTHKFYQADVLILGGDITGKVIVPMTRQPDGHYTASLLGNQYDLETEQDLVDFEQRTAMAGFYAYRTTPDEIQALEADKAALDRLFARLMDQRIEQWLALADERLQGTGARCFITPGNDDQFSIDRLFEASACVMNPEGKVVMVDDDHEMLSSGWSTYTPWNSPRETTEVELGHKISAMVSQVNDMENCIFNLHNPPYDTKIDAAPKLDENLKPVLSGGSLVMSAVGSRSVREAIENHQPLLSLHGHVHESRGVQRLGRTLTINPGSTYSDGILQGAIINLPRKKRDKLRYQLIAG